MIGRIEISSVKVILTNFAAVKISISSKKWLKTTIPLYNLPVIMPNQMMIQKQRRLIIMQFQKGKCENLSDPTFRLYLFCLQITQRIDDSNDVSR